MTTHEKEAKCHDCPIDMIEFGKLQQKVDSIEHALTGEEGVLVLLRRQNGRVRKLEVNQAYILGGVAVIGTVVTIVIKLI